MGYLWLYIEALKPKFYFLNILFISKRMIFFSSSLNSNSHLILLIASLFNSLEYWYQKHSDFLLDTCLAYYIFHKKNKY